MSWYNSLNKPIFTPPAALFAPVWTILYMLIAISGLMIYQKGLKNKKVKYALKIFAIQLFLNIIWSPIFFGAHHIGWALVVVTLLLFFIYKTIKVFKPIDKTASILLWPYFIWVSFALLLNFSLWLVNK